MQNAIRRIYIDPSYSAYYESRLFDTSNPVLNRDGTLEPFSRLRSTMQLQDAEVDTADRLLSGNAREAGGEYYSLGILDNFRVLAKQKNIRLRGFVIMEPPVVAPKLYRALPDLTRYFERVYLHNTEGDGYSLKGVDQSRLRNFYWPQPRIDVDEQYWHNQNRQNRIVVINGNHIPRSLRGELYSKRIKAMAALAKSGVVDLYGRGWEKWWSHRSMWPPYWFNYHSLMSIYKGPCESKYQVLSQYKFCLCFENMAMTGYVTEKIFDCLYAGCVPVYLGAKNIEKLIPPETYIDGRNFSTWEAMWAHLTAMSSDDVEMMRNAGRNFIAGSAYLKYYNSLIDVVNG